MESKDKSTILIIIVILIVCFLALGVIGTLTWRYVGGPINDIADELSKVTGISNLDYNFDIPEVDE